MRAAVAEVLEEQLAPRFRDLTAAQQLRRLLALAVAEIGRHAGMHLSDARAFDERILSARRANKSRSVVVGAQRTTPWPTSTTTTDRSA